MNEFIDLLFKKIAGPAPVSVATLDGVVHTLFTVLDRIPASPLTARQKQKLSGYLFLEGPLIVYEVIQVLRRKWPLFPDIAVDPQELADSMARASCWIVVREFGLHLAACADAHYTLERATHVSRALGVLRQVRAERLRPFPGDLDEQRRSAMRGAEELLQRHLQGGKKK